MPRQVCSTRKSLSLLTMISAPAARAGSKYLSSLGSRQSVTRTEGSNQMAMPRRASKNCRRRTNEMTFANFGRLSTSAISVSTGADKASTSISSARNNARSGTLSALSAALTKVDASKTINFRCGCRVALHCARPARRRCQRRSILPPGLTLQGGDGPRERARPGVRTQHAADEPSDGVAIARVSERLGDLCFDRDCHINGLVHNRLRKKYNSFTMAVPWRLKEAL
jgi:hypothetical protein